MRGSYKILSGRTNEGTYIGRSREGTLTFGGGPPEFWIHVHSASPVLSHPATLGCIEHAMLPAAWGRGHIQTHWTSEGDGSVYIHGPGLGGEELWRIEMVPKAEALAAALMAAPVATEVPQAPDQGGS